MLKMVTFFISLVVPMLVYQAQAAPRKVEPLSRCPELGDRVPAFNQEISSFQESYVKYNRSHVAYQGHCETIHLLPEKKGNDRSELDRAEEVEKIKVEQLTVGGNLKEFKTKYGELVEHHRELRKTSNLSVKCQEELQIQGHILTLIGQDSTEPDCDTNLSLTPTSTAPSQSSPPGEGIKSRLRNNELRQNNSGGVAQ